MSASNASHGNAESRVPEPRRRDWLQSVWWRRLWSDRAARDPFTGFLVREYRRLTDG